MICPNSQPSTFANQSISCPRHFPLAPRGLRVSSKPQSSRRRCRSALPRRGSFSKANILPEPAVLGSSHGRKWCLYPSKFSIFRVMPYPTGLKSCEKYGYQPVINQLQFAILQEPGRCEHDDRNMIRSWSYHQQETAMEKPPVVAWSMLVIVQVKTTLK